MLALWLIIYDTNELSMNLAGYRKVVPWRNLSRAYRFNHPQLKSA